jgi:hypothetical protein
MVELGNSSDLEGSETDLPNTQADDFSEQQSNSSLPTPAGLEREESEQQSAQVTVLLT